MTNLLLARGMRAGQYRPNPLMKLDADLRPVDEFTLNAHPTAISAREVLVPDISFWNDDNQTTRKVDFHQMRVAGAPGVIIRGGQGSWIDEDFASYWAAAKAEGLPRGSYWYYDPRISAKNQADLFASLFANDPPELSLTLDAEYPESWGGAYAGFQYLYDFLERLKVNVPQLGKEIYTGYYWWYDYIWSKITAGQLAYFRQYPLHLAWYINDPSYVKIPAPWTQTEFRWWQQTDKGDGLRYGVESLNIDLNYFVQGGLDLFKSTYHLAGSTTPPDTEKIDVIFNGAATRITGTKYSPRQINYTLHIIDTAQADFVVTDPNPDGTLTPMRTSDFAKHYDTDIAINGDEGYPDLGGFFVLKRRSMAHGQKYGAQNDGATVSLSKAPPYQISVSWGGYAAFCYNAISGSKLLLENGTYGNFIDDLPPAPRTVFGWNGAGSKFYWLTIDGRGAGGSLGATLRESADLIKSFGAVFAVNHDGGGSTTKVEKVNGIQTILNVPSDGAERYVANHWGVKFRLGGTPMPTGDYVKLTTTLSRAIRLNYRVDAARIVSNSDFLVNTIAKAGATPADTYTHIVDYFDKNGVKIGYAGDVWVKVFENNGVPVEGWMAKIHKGIPQITAELITTTPTTQAATLDITIADPVTGKKYGATGIQLPELPG